jgi:NAD(P)-dependent dehydrogenase (short-subunit alcohol dehydrogenase family)
LTDDFPRFELEGQTALVTGASRGIGRDLARALAHAGARVAVAARTATDLDELVGELGAGALAIRVDLRDVASVRSAVAGRSRGWVGSTSS